MQNAPMQTYTPEQLARRRAERAARRRKKKILQILIIAAALVILFIIAACVRTVWKWTEGSRAVAKYGTAKYDVSGYVFNPQDPRLVLVNSNCLLGSDYTPETIVADEATGEQLSPEAADAFQRMAQAAAKEKITLVLNSGYRDYNHQEQLFTKHKERYLLQGYDEEKAQATARTVVAPPGGSEHQTGYAADITASDYTSADTGFADTKAHAWLVRYAPDYGFIERYPEKRQAATGVIYEPWHWRYVGVENARAITASELSLEEFLALHTTTGADNS